MNTSTEKSRDKKDRTLLHALSYQIYKVRIMAGVALGC